MSITDALPAVKALLTAGAISRGSVILSLFKPIPFAISDISKGVSKLE